MHRLLSRPPGGTIEARPAVRWKFSRRGERTAVQDARIRQSSGQVSRTRVRPSSSSPGGSVAVPIQINGASGGVPGAVVSLLCGGAITGALTFEGPGGTFNDNSTARRRSLRRRRRCDQFAASGNTADFGSTGGDWDSVTGSGEAVAKRARWSASSAAARRSHRAPDRSPASTTRRAIGMR